MQRSGGDDGPEDAPVPGSEPEPAELWIHGAPSDATADTSDRTGTAYASREGTSIHGPGGAGHTRWIALAAGFLILVAVIAVQHFAGGHPAASLGISTTTRSSSPTIDSSPSRTAGSPSSRPSQTSGMVGMPVDSAQAHLSGQGLAVDSGSRSPAGTVTTGPAGTTSSTTTPAPDTTSPTSTTVPRQPAAGDWELVGYGPSGVVRYRPATGTITTTPVPPIGSGNVLSFVVTRSAAVIRSMDSVPGYLVPDGKAAAPLAGLLARGTRALPGPDPQHLWVVQESSTVGVQEGSEGTGDPAGLRMPDLSLVLVDGHGAAVGTSITLPRSLSIAGAYGINPDGAGYALAYGIGGIYQVHPDGLHLVTHGQLLAIGPTEFLAYECDETASCAMVAIDRATWKRRPLSGLTLRVQTLAMIGVISPDGDQAAVITSTPRGLAIDLVDMHSGKVQHTGITLTGDPSGSLAFAPDGGTLVVADGNEVLAVNPITGKAHLLPVPALSHVVLRPGR